jgi:hypothetical protein
MRVIPHDDTEFILKMLKLSLFVQEHLRTETTELAINCKLRISANEA